MADERDRVARDDKGNLFRLDATSGEWVPATGPDIQVIASGVRGDITSAIEGFIPITGILEQFGAVEPGFAQALGNINPTATAAGEVGALASGMFAASKLMGLGFGMARAATGGVPRGALTVQKLERVAEKGQRAVPRADIGEFVAGTQPGVLRGGAQGVGATVQGFVEQSKVLTRMVQSIPGLRGITRNVERQVFANFAGIRGTALKAADFGADGKLAAGALIRNHKATNKLYRSALDPARANDTVQLGKSGQSLLAALKTVPKAERTAISQILTKEQIKAGKMTNQQLWQRHKELRALSRKTDNDVVRDAVDKITNELEILMRQSKGINVQTLNEAKEAWRFEQMLNSSVGESGQLNYSTLVNKAEKFFAREFGLEDVAGASQRDITLSAKGQDAISTLLEIKRAGGVSAPNKAVSAADWIVVLSGLSAAAGGGLVTAGVF